MAQQSRRPKFRSRKCIEFGLLAALAGSGSAFALDGEVGIHDPSTITYADGKYYVYGTGGGSLVSDDGWTWRRGARPALTGLAPDVIRIGDRYVMYVARGGVQPQAQIDVIWSKSLDPASPDYKWNEGGMIVRSDGVEDSNAIDPGVFRDPNDGRLWLVYGSYFGYIRLVELDPNTGARKDPKSKPIDLAINCEASDMIYHDGWYYLLATHGSCCRGTDSGYNIRMGRSRKVTGPFLDAEGVDMIQGGGKLLITSGERKVGPGHFGLLDLADGVQKFSMHWEADLDRGGASVLDIRPLQWKDGWPVAGENAKEGTYEIRSVHTGTSLQMAVEGIPVGGPRRRPQGPPPSANGAAPGAGAAAAPRPSNGNGAAGGPPAGFGGIFGGTGSPISDQTASQVESKWPPGDVAAAMDNYELQAQQKWQIAPVAGSGGYPGSPYFKITIAGTDRALAATADGELVVRPSFTGGPEQLWRLDQLADGSWRIMPKALPNSQQPVALSAIGASSATLSRFDPNSDKQHWLLRTP